MYRLISFCGVSLEYYNQVEPVGSGPTPTAYIPLMDGGALDAYGSQQKAPGMVERVKSLRLQATTPAALSTLYFGLMALRGKRGVLTRRMLDGTEHWQYARLVEVAAVRDYQKTRFNLIQDLDLRFNLQEATWRGIPATWYLNDGWVLNYGLNFNQQKHRLGITTVIPITLGLSTDTGRAPVRAIKMTIVAGDAAITGLSIVRTGGETLTWAGTLAAGNSLVIDIGTMQVTNNGADAYAGLTIAATADMAAWLTLLPGDNTVTVIRTGGGYGSTIEFEYDEAWY